MKPHEIGFSPFRKSWWEKQEARKCILGVIPSFSSLTHSGLIFQFSQANLKEAEVSIPAKLHNSLIGSKGSLVRSVMEECGGVHIHFPAEGSGLDKVTIRGPAEEVERAKRQLLQLAEEKVSNEIKI